MSFHDVCSVKTPGIRRVVSVSLPFRLYEPRLFICACMWCMRPWYPMKQGSYATGEEDARGEKERKAECYLAKACSLLVVGAAGVLGIVPVVGTP